MTRVLLLCFALLGTLPLGASVQDPAAGQPTRDSARTITDRSMDWPAAAQWRRVVFLQDHNTRVVLAGTAMLGIAAGVIGSFTLLRKRALMGDALSHSMLPGIGLAFMVAVSAGYNGKALPVLLIGATLSGLLGLGTILLLRNYTRLKEDTALGIVLSVFFGAGVAVLGVVQRMGSGHAAGLESFIYGKTASMLSSDAMMIGAAAALVIGVCTLFFKEFKLLCFDADYAATLGWPTLVLDVVLMALVVMVTVIGLQAVGLILVIALLIIPATAARFWTERLPTMILVSAVIGAASAAIGSAASALWPNLPSGAMIVLAGAILFAVSVFFGLKRGVLIRWLRHHDLATKVRRQHLLRGLYELMEADGLARRASILPHPVSWVKLLALRSWSPREVRREVARATRMGLVRSETGRTILLTEFGLKEATRIVRNHRLWELFLITHADIAPSHVDRDADALEHVLGPETVQKLELLLMEQASRDAVPASPHRMD